MDFHSESLQSVLAEVDTNVEKGLTKEQVSKRIEKFGQNKLKEKKKKTWAARFFEQFKDVMIVILIIAAVVSFVIACIEKNPKEFFEPALILLIVVVNAIMGVMQESKAEKALEALNNMSAPHARVIRDGEEIGGAVYVKSQGKSFVIDAKNRLKNGDGVFVTTDTAVNQRVLSAEKRGEIHFSLTFTEGERAIAEWNGIRFESDNILQSAQNRPLSKEELVSCFSKADGLPADIYFDEININGNIFVPKSEFYFYHGIFDRTRFSVFGVTMHVRERQDRKKFYVRGAGDQ